MAYPTTKPEKVIPLQKAIKSYIDQKASERNLEINIEVLYFEVEDTGVGEQPLHPKGLVGALNRIYYIQDALLGKRVWKQKDFKRPVVQRI